MNTTERTSVRWFMARFGPRRPRRTGYPVYLLKSCACAFSTRALRPHHSQRETMLQKLIIAAALAVLTGCGITLPEETWYVPDRHISAADTAELARLFCECLPYRCEGGYERAGSPDQRLLFAARHGRSVSMADVGMIGSVSECKASVLPSLNTGGPVAPGARSRLRAFTATVRPID